MKYNDYHNRYNLIDSLMLRLKQINLKDNLLRIGHLKISKELHRLNIRHYYLRNKFYKLSHIGYKLLNY
jgi:hypothetical protein